MQQPTIHHDAGHRLFEFAQEGKRGHLEYRVADGVLTILHTIVDPALGGRGYGGLLVEAARRHARSAGLQIASRCSYASHYLSTRTPGPPPVEPSM